MSAPIRRSSTPTPGLSSFSDLLNRRNSAPPAPPIPPEPLIRASTPRGLGPSQSPALTPLAGTPPFLAPFEIEDLKHEAAGKEREAPSVLVPRGIFNNLVPAPSQITVARIVLRINHEEERNQKIADQIIQKAKELLELREKDLASVRKSYCKLACISSVHYPSEKKNILYTLLDLLVRDTGGSSQSEGVLEMAQTLMSELHLEKIELETTEFKQLLFWTYASILELILSYSLRRLVELSPAFKNQLNKLSEELDKLGTRDVVLSFQTHRIKQITACLSYDEESEQHRILQNKVRDVFEALQKSRLETFEEGVKMLTNVCICDNPDAWFIHFFGMKQLLSAARGAPNAIVAILKAISSSRSIEYVLGGLELLYHVIREKNQETQKYAMEGCANEKIKDELSKINGLSQWSRSVPNSEVPERCYKVRTMALVLLNHISATEEKKSRCWAVARTHLIHASEENDKDRYSREIRETANALLGYEFLNEGSYKRQQEEDKKQIEIVLASRG